MNPVLRLDHRYHDVEDHDRGLVYDLATLDRRRMLKLLGLGGISAGLFTIVGCNPSGSNATPGATATATAGASQARRDRQRGRGVVRGHPRGDRRPVPGRRLERPRRAHPERRRPQGHPVELRVVVGRRRRAFRSRSSLAHRGRRRLRAARRRGRLRLALRPGRQLLALLAGRGERELPARRPGRRRRRRRDVRRASSRPATRAAGRTSTSRSIPSLETATDEANKIATSQIALPKDVCDTVYATVGLRAERPEPGPGSASQSDMVFGDDGGVHQLGTMSGDVAGGYAVRLTVPVNG